MRTAMQSQNLKVTTYTSRKMSLNYALDILMYSCRFCS